MWYRFLHIVIQESFLSSVHPPKTIQQFRIWPIYCRYIEYIYILKTSSSSETSWNAVSILSVCPTWNFLLSSLSSDHIELPISLKLTKHRQMFSPSLFQKCLLVKRQVDNKTKLKSPITTTLCIFQILAICFSKISSVSSWLCHSQ